MSDQPEEPAGTDPTIMPGPDEGPDPINPDVPTDPGSGDHDEGDDSDGSDHAGSTPAGAADTASISTPSEGQSSAE